MSTRAALLALALAACADAGAQPPEPPAPVRPVNPGVTAYHMRRHFNDLRMIERLLLSGRVDEGTALAYLLVGTEADPALAPFAPELRRVSTAAQELVKAKSVDEALRREVRVAAACADCHAATKVTPPLAPAPPEPPLASGAPARMARHAWAADRLWEGVVGGDEARWTAGLRVLANAPLPMAPLTDATPLGARLQHLAADQLRARPTTDLDERAAAYGEILVTCAACHASLRSIALQP